MREIRFAIFYLDLYVDRIYKRDRNIKMFCAIASSTGIAAWTVWREYAFLWSLIIAISQVVNAVKGYLPYNIILKNIRYSEKNLKRLYNKIEYNWFQIKLEEFSEEKINEVLYDLKETYVEIESQCFEGEIPLYENKKMHKKAEEKTNLYFKNLFEDC